MIKKYLKWKAELDKQVQFIAGICLSDVCNNDERIRGLFDNGLSTEGAARMLISNR